MSDMTPKEAQDYLKNASILGIAHHERRALETIANMSKVWGIEYTGIKNGNQHTEFYTGTDSKDQAEYQFRSMARMGMNPRIIHRHVTVAIDNE